MAAPTIFSAARRIAVRRRALRWPDAPRYVLDDMVDDVLERLSFLRHAPSRSLVIGDLTGRLVAEFGAEAGEPAKGFDEERPYPDGGYDFIASLGTLDTVNDLPGALIHLRDALSPGGLAIASFVGAGSLPALRAAMLAADGERPAARMHPAVDVRAGAQLLQRAGFADPVADGRTLTVRYASLDRLVADLRAQGLGNVLANSGPTLGKCALATARTAFGAGTEERFEIVTLTGWRPSTGSG